ncbi:hypothetical protein D3C75_1350920 [compost metagenome]
MYFTTKLTNVPLAVESWSPMRVRITCLTWVLNTTFSKVWAKLETMTIALAPLSFS